MGIGKIGTTSRNWVIGACIVMACAAQCLAVDRYSLEIPESVMIGGPSVLIKVIPFSASETDLLPHAVKFVGLPLGVRVESLAGSSTLNVAGPTEFRLFVDPSMTERRVVVRVQKSNDKSVNGFGYFNVDRTVAKFSLTPVGMNPLQLGVPFRFQVVAQDQEGAIVPSFNDAVDLKVDFGSVQGTEIEGPQFIKGIAYVDLVFSDDEPLPRSNRLTAIARALYVGQSDRAVGTIEFTPLPKASIP